jgi:hypothetical protein
MAQTTFFDQECPTCGRRLRVPVQYLGKKVKCQHCRAPFEAWDKESGIVPPTQTGVGLLQRAEELLASAETRRGYRPR